MLVDRRAAAGAGGPAPSAAPAVEDPEVVALAEALIHSRRHRSARRLRLPGPDGAQLARIVAAAAAAPDHGRLTPWRFVLVPAERRAALGELFAQALRERDPQADELACGDAREKALRGPVLIVCVVDLGPRELEVPAEERLVSLGCALQNMMLTAHAMGFGSGLLAGKALGSAALRQGFGLGVDERAVCFLAIGSVDGGPPAGVRPAPERYVTTWEG